MSPALRRAAFALSLAVGTSMRQPEVSIGMRGLRQNNWIEEHEVKREGKGPPTKVYKLTVPIDKITQHYEEQKSQEAAQTMQAIQRLKEMAST